MNAKFALLFLLVGVASAGFLNNAHRQSSVKKSFTSPLKIKISSKDTQVQKLQQLVNILSAKVASKDVWTDLLNALMTQLVQTLADLENLGIEVSDELLAQVEDLILVIMAEGGLAWEHLLALLEEYSLELNEVLGELLAELGIIG